MGHATRTAQHAIVAPQVEEVMRRGKSHFIDDQAVALVGKDRTEEVYWTVGYSPVYGDDGEISGVLAVCTDTTASVVAARHRAEQAQMRASLEAADRAKDAFLATMSHELRTPLNAMLGWVRLLRDQSNDQAKIDKGLAVIERNALTQARLVSDLLDVSRILSGKLGLSPSFIDVKSVIGAAVDVVKPAAAAKLVDLVVDIDAGVGKIRADADRLQQIVWNLLSNAVRFTPANGVVILSARRASALVRIDVEDNGIGIASEHLPHVFERFRQVDVSAKRASGGLGLGLAIARYLVEAHGGGIEARSEGIGRGASFSVTLPTRADGSACPGETDGEGQPDVTPNVSEVTRLDGVRVLVVDDDDDSLELLREALEGAGARVEAARSAQQALAAAGRFDVIVSDIGMPEMDGYCFMQHARRHEVGTDVPAIALTAYARAEDAERALKAGYQEHIAKPVDADRLIDAIKRWARQKGAVATSGA